MSNVKLKILYDKRKKSTLSLESKRSAFLKKVTAILKKHFGNIQCDAFFIGSIPEKPDAVLIELSVQKKVGMIHMHAATKEIHAMSTENQQIGIELKPVEIIL